MDTLLKSAHTSKEVKKFLENVPSTEGNTNYYLFCSLRIKNSVVKTLVQEKFYIPSTELTDLTGMKRDDVIPYYRWLIIMNSKNEQEAPRLASLVIKKWSHRALEYILTKAWEGLM